MQPYKYTLFNETLTLLPFKAIWWESKKTLIISDWHIGKVGHFRKEGIPVPAKLYDNEKQRLEEIVKLFPLGKLLILGDLFHSLPNEETRNFNGWIHQFSFDVELVVGNHDDYSLQEISDKIKHTSVLIQPPFIFTHEPLENNEIDTSLYGLSGHIHPTVHLKGKGKQHLKLPCFFFDKHRGILPAFGNFTGGFSMNKYKNGLAFPITTKQVFSPVKLT